MFPTAHESNCQQMTWPLTYDDGINLHEKTCNEEAYFLCRFKCKFRTKKFALLQKYKKNKSN